MEENTDDEILQQLPLQKKRKEGNQAAKKLMKTQRLRKINKGYPIDVEEPRPQKPVETWIPELGLLKTDQDSLSPTGWLTDSIIDAAQKLLQRTSPHSGFQSVTNGLGMTFEFEAGESSFRCYTQELIIGSLCLGLVQHTQLCESMIACTHQLVRLCSPRSHVCSQHRIQELF